MKALLCLISIGVAAVVFSGCAYRETRLNISEEYRGEGLYYEVEQGEETFTGGKPASYEISHRCFIVYQVAPVECEWRKVTEEFEYKISHRVDYALGNFGVGVLMIPLTPLAVIAGFNSCKVSLESHLYFTVIQLNIFSSRYSGPGGHTCFSNDARLTWKRTVPMPDDRGKWQPVASPRRRKIIYRDVELRVPSLDVCRKGKTDENGDFAIFEDKIENYYPGYSKSYVDVPAEFILEPGTPDEVVIPFTIRVGQN